MKHSNINFVLIVSLITTFLVIYWLFFSALETKVNSEGIYYKYKPFIWRYKKIAKDDIKSYSVRKYSAMREYGGWGLRRSFKNGKAYITKGNQGLQLVMKNGKKVLFGTQKPFEIERAMQKMMNDNQASDV